jgi:phosphatidylinositol 4-kinase A
MPIVLQLAPGDDLGMSYMYSLLNHIAATSKEPYEVAVVMNNNTLSDSADSATLFSIETGLRGLTEEEKRLVAISTISVVTRLALEFKDEEVAQWLFMFVLVAH